jgi:addiction module HigA family antidote
VPDWSSERILVARRLDRISISLAAVPYTPRPGDVICSLCLEQLGLTVTNAAAAPGVSRKTLSALLNGRASVSPEMAVRLSIAFDTSAEMLMNQQRRFDLWHAERRRKKLKVTRLAA